MPTMPQVYRPAPAVSTTDSGLLHLHYNPFSPALYDQSDERQALTNDDSMMNHDDVEMGKSNKHKQEQFEIEGDTEYRPVNWKKVFLTPKYIPIWILVILAAIATALLTIKHDQVVAAARPFSEKIRDIPAGWLIPIAILFIISFPPLFGHEIIALLCGVVYDLWIGFAIVAAGTFLGEIGTWFVFKRFLRKKAVKLERTNLNYGSMARITRDGGFWIVFIIRLSVIPSHFSTAVFSTADVKFWHFAVATFLTLPKQLVLVYLGVLLVQQGNQNSGDNMIKNVVFGIAFVVTFILAGYIWYKMRAVKKVLIVEQQQRKAERSRMLQNPPDQGLGVSNYDHMGRPFGEPPATPLGPRQSPGTFL